MWIKLHFSFDGDEVAVQTQNICMVYPSTEGKGSTVSFIGSEDNYIKVRETVDEIGAKITE